MMWALGLIYMALVGVLNAGAGRGFWGLVSTGSKYIFAIGTGAGGALLFQQDAWFAVGVAVGVWLWRTPGWGDFFPAVHGVKSGYRTTGDAKWATWLSDLVWRVNPKPGLQLRLKATLDMAMRQALIVPTIVFAAVYMQHLWGLLACAGFPLMGLAYLIGGLLSKERAVEIAEYINGFLIAIFLIIVYISN